MGAPVAAISCSNCSTRPTEPMATASQPPTSQWATRSRPIQRTHPSLKSNRPMRRRRPLLSVRRSAPLRGRRLCPRRKSSYQRTARRRQSIRTATDPRGASNDQTIIFCVCLVGPGSRTSSPRSADIPELQLVNLFVRCRLVRTTIGTESSLVSAAATVSEEGFIDAGKNLPIGAQQISSAGQHDDVTAPMRCAPDTSKS